MSSATQTHDDVIFRETTDRFWFLHLVTEVREDGLYVRLEPVQRSFRQVRASRIRDVTATDYDAATFGGWHWGLHRSPSGNTAYRLRGDQGVEVTLANGDRWFIGSQRPSELEAALERVILPGESSSVETG